VLNTTNEVQTTSAVQVLGAVPRLLEQQAAALDEEQKQQQPQQEQQDAAAAEGGSSEAAAAGQQEQEQPSQQEQQQVQEGVQASLEAKGVPSELAAAVDAALKLDDDTLAAVSRAIMGRLDIVDLVGKNTAYEVAERVSV
jgi:hypothetical protein